MIDIFQFTKGRLNKLALPQLSSQRLSRNNLIWVNMVNPTPDEISFISKKFKLHPTTAGDLTNPSTRIKYEEFPYNTFIVYKGVSSMYAGSVKFYTLFFIDGEHYIITSSGKEIETIEALKQNMPKLESLMRKGEDAVFHHIIDREVDKYMTIREHFFDELETIQRSFAEHTTQTLLSQLFLKEMEILKIKQRSDSITEVCVRLTKPTDNFVQNTLIPYFRDVYDHAARVSEALKNYLDIITGIRNSYLSMSSNKTNQAMRTLTIIMAVLMPMSIITGFYGMNINLPMQNNPNEYITLIFLMLVICLLMLFIFYRLGWLNDKNN